MFILCSIGILDEVIKPLRESKKWKVCYFFFVCGKYTFVTAYTGLKAEFYYVLEGLKQYFAWDMSQLTSDILFTIGHTAGLLISYMCKCL